MPAALFRTLMRAQGGLVWVPELDGTASQWPFGLRQVFGQRALTVPYLAVSRFITSSIGSSLSAWWCTSQVREMQRVVAGPGLRLGGLGQQQLVADRGDEVDVAPRPCSSRPRHRTCLLHHVVAGRHPVVPEADGDLAGGAGRCGCAPAAVPPPRRPSLSALRREIRPLRVISVPPAAAAEAKSSDDAVTLCQRHPAQSPRLVRSAQARPTSPTCPVSASRQSFSGRSPPARPAPRRSPAGSSGLLAAAPSSGCGCARL